MFKEKLLAEKTKLEMEMATVGRKNPSNPADWEPTPPKAEDVEADSNEAADRIEGYEENTAILTELETRYQSVTPALGKIAAGAYGTCEVDGERIEEERLLADPAARTCTKHIGVGERP
jgi:RNA polymerase-binding transcription factor DksA